MEERAFDLDVHLLRGWRQNFTTTIGVDSEPEDYDNQVVRRTFQRICQLIQQLWLGERLLWVLNRRSLRLWFH